MSQLEDNLASLDLQLSHEQVKALDQAGEIEMGFPYHLYEKELTRGLGSPTEVLVCAFQRNLHRLQPLPNSTESSSSARSLPLPVGQIPIDRSGARCRIAGRPEGFGKEPSVESKLTFRLEPRSSAILLTDPGKVPYED